MKFFLSCILIIALYAQAECPFCDPQILAKQTLLIQDEAMILCTHKPVIPGHLLISPIRHVERFDDLTDQELCSMKAMIAKVHKAAQSLFGIEDYLLLQKNGTSAGQTVPHVHIHYFPRSKEIGSLGFATRLLLRGYRHAITDEEMREQVDLWKTALD